LEKLLALLVFFPPGATPYIRDIKSRGAITAPTYVDDKTFIEWLLKSFCDELVSTNDGDLPSYFSPENGYRRRREPYLSFISIACDMLWGAVEAQAMSSQAETAQQNN
jgi:hypothetical protein